MNRIEMVRRIASAFSRDLSTYSINTSNVGKYREFQAYGLGALSWSRVDLPEANADALTVIQHKASQLGPKILVEDTSLDVQGANVGVNVRWMLDHLDQYVGRKAQIVTLVGVLEEDGKVHVYRGVLSGTIVEPRGAGGFGFDPVFLPNGARQTLAEHKNPQQTARYKAVQNFLHDRAWRIVPPLKDWSGEMQHT